MEEKMRERAGQMYEMVCCALDKKNFKYVKNEEKLQVLLGIKDSNRSISVGIAVEEKKQRIHLCSPWEIKVSGEKCKDIVAAVCEANAKLVDGCMVYNVPNNVLEFKVSVSLWDSKAGEGIVDYLIGSAYAVAARFGEMFDKLNKGEMSLDEFRALC